MGIRARIWRLLNAHSERRNRPLAWPTPELCARHGIVVLGLVHSDRDRADAHHMTRGRRRLFLPIRCWRLLLILANALPDPARITRQAQAALRKQRAIAVLRRSPLFGRRRWGSCRLRHALLRGAS